MPFDSRPPASFTNPNLISPPASSASTKPPQASVDASAENYQEVASTGDTLRANEIKQYYGSLRAHTLPRRRPSATNIFSDTPADIPTTDDSENGYLYISQAIEAELPVVNIDNPIFSESVPGAVSESASQSKIYSRAPRHRLLGVENPEDAYTTTDPTLRRSESKVGGVIQAYMKEHAASTPVPVDNESDFEPEEYDGVATPKAYVVDNEEFEPEEAEFL
jgi:hypothetical protein